MKEVTFPNAINTNFRFRNFEKSPAKFDSDIPTNLSTKSSRIG